MVWDLLFQNNNLTLSDILFTLLKNDGLNIWHKRKQDKNTD